MAPPGGPIDKPAAKACAAGCMSELQPTGQVHRTRVSYMILTRYVHPPGRCSCQCGPHQAAVAPQRGKDPLAHANYPLYSFFFLFDFSSKMHPRRCLAVWVWFPGKLKYIASGLQAGHGSTTGLVDRSVQWVSTSGTSTSTCSYRPKRPYRYM